EKGTRYLREHMRFLDEDNNVVYWYHGLRIQGDRELKLLTSECGDDFYSIPMYEQIYALCGPCMTYRLTGDPEILWDIQQTICLFEKYFKDSETAATSLTSIQSRSIRGRSLWRTIVAAKTGTRSATTRRPI